MFGFWFGKVFVMLCMCEVGIGLETSMWAVLAFEGACAGNTKWSCLFLKNVFKIFKTVFLYAYVEFAYGLHLQFQS